MTDTAQDTTRRIMGSIIQGGRIYTAGDEEKLAGVLPQSDIDRHLKSGVLTGDWNAQTSGAGSAAGSDETTAATEPDEPAEETDTEHEEGLPSLASMGDHLAGITDADQIRALRRRDKRKGAKPFYKARLAELAEG